MSGQGKKRRRRLGEFAIIARYFAPLATNPAALGLLDDAAVLAIPEGQELVVTCDTIIEGVHFLTNDPPETIAHKALAVNLSDLAAKGARPYAYLLALALPGLPSAPWLEGFAIGLRALQERVRHRAWLAATLPPPQGRSPSRSLPWPRAARRGGAAEGRHGRRPPLCERNDRRCRSRAEASCESLASRRIGGCRQRRALFSSIATGCRKARNALALPLRQCARAAIDVSDGLVGDTMKLCKASGVSAMIEAARVPLSPAAGKAVAKEPELLAELVTAGDDYEIVAAMRSLRMPSAFEKRGASSTASRSPPSVRSVPGAARSRCWTRRAGRSSSSATVTRISNNQ